MNIKQCTTLALSILILSCGSRVTSNLQSETNPVFQNKGHELVYKMVKVVGDYNVLKQKKDVVYTYTYQTPDGKSDVSTEKYIFDGELSYGMYKKHERTFPDLEGTIEQGYDGKEYWLKHNGTIMEDSTRLKRVAFSRPTNFYWFAMLPKLLDPNLKYEYLGTKSINTLTYDIVKVTFSSSNNKPTDIYQLYINRQTSLVDQFLFTVADFGVMEIPNLMRLKYEIVDGVIIPSTREYKKSNWNADVSDEPWISVNWTNIKFKNKLSKADFIN